ncbi:WcaF family extracellular polysaccharide biosynthesis acetyltransferase [Pedobacter sp. MC2016-14]|uniref:WcaF family extracellular polysaccharide biosynthesis acetyltransferase n=1 Tax=Pedobacter sp. MC2016-14 TaxID=2897327 RepID=UPI001E402081|nr:WcaF family extracellular polysaccharide biosynthesis acetyltransferase [Pedobacter sp. MC2016-14]MCD0486857.1 WcaF family extracellular polysaccharide biosynthesis acetyltransferase [Pedobacter sp. MC2016-14]
MNSELVNTDTHVGASFSLKNRIGRLVWGLVYQILFRFSPRPFHGWRSFLLRLFGANVGNGVHVYPGVKIWAPWNLELHDECGIGSGANLYSQGKITIGRRAVVSQGAYLCAGTHDYTKQGFPLLTAPITIGEQVWIAAEAFVHPGVTIGDGAVIGARSVVIRDMPSWMVCAGNPAKPLKERIITDLNTATI